LKITLADPSCDCGQPKKKVCFSSGKIDRERHENVSILGGKKKDYEFRTQRLASIILAENAPHYWIYIVEM